MNAPIGSTTDGPVDAYEALRRTDRVTHAVGALGRALLMGRGLTAWVRAWSALPAPVAPSRCVARTCPASSGSTYEGPTREAARILASMVLANLQDGPTPP